MIGVGAPGFLGAAAALEVAGLTGALWVLGELWVPIKPGAPGALEGPKVVVAGLVMAVWPLMAVVATCGLI